MASDTQHLSPAHGARRASVDVDLGLRQYMLRVYNCMGGGLALTGLVAFFGAASGLYASLAGTPVFWIVLSAPLALVFFLSFRIERMSLGAAQLSFWAYAALVGLSLSGIFLVYTGISIARVFFIAAAIFGATSLYGYTTHRDLTRFGSFLFMGLTGIVIAGLTNIFLASSALQFTISLIGVAMFTGLVAYDTQRIRDIYIGGEAAPPRARRRSLAPLLFTSTSSTSLLMLLQLFGGDRRR
jgi:FtsH-binding integral membrane protein